jgi:response regulator of citrate/malate metabolism
MNEGIIQSVCEYYSITPAQLFDLKGNEAIVWAKRCYAFIMFYHSPLNIDAIAEKIQRSKTTTYRYIDWFNDVYVANKEVRVLISSIIYNNS